MLCGYFEFVFWMLDSISRILSLFFLFYDYLLIYFYLFQKRGSKNDKLFPV